MNTLLKASYMLGLVVLVLAASSLRAQESGLALKVQTTGGQMTYHIGERISLKLTFSSPNDTQYVIAPWSNGRRGEFDLESFDLSPSTGWSDPLATYFAQGFPLTGGHGWELPPLLKSKPVEISLDLNQWVRFDEPGVYRIKVISHRVSVSGGLQSNAIELHIVPATPEWQEARLKASLGKREASAVGDLRYLATPLAIEEMTNQLRQGDDFPATDCSMGLIGLPSAMRDVAIASMNRRIGEPDFPISTLFVSTMSFLHVSPGSTAESIGEQRHAFEAMLWQTVFNSIPKKEPAARAQTVQTLLWFRPNIETPEVRSQVASLLSSSFLNLDNRSQIDDLRQHWDLLRSPEFLPVLQILAKRPATNDGDQGPYSREDLKSVALKRWCELDAVGARNEILAQIGSTDPALSAYALRFMPAEGLPQFESSWAEAFVGTMDQAKEDVLGSLLVKFGTGAAKSQMIGKLSEPRNPYSCTARSLALAYLVRFSPHDTRPLLKREIESEEKWCNDSLLRFISDHATAPVMNEVAVESLNDRDPAVVLDALQYLKAYGTKSDEKPLWERYVAWTNEWSGKANILDDPGTGMHDCGEVCTGEALGEALMANQGWLADQGLISRVLDKCVGKVMCKKLKERVRFATPPYRVTLPDATDPSGIEVAEAYNVAQYTSRSRDLLEEKIRQYPAGTEFFLSRAWGSTEDQRKLEDDVQALFKKNGMLLEEPASRGIRSISPN